VDEEGKRFRFEQDSILRVLNAAQAGQLRVSKPLENVLPQIDDSSHVMYSPRACWVWWLEQLKVAPRRLPMLE
jgi:hypothetical protein